MQFNYKTQGTCSQTISLDITNGIISNVSFFGGCNGNLKGGSADIAELAPGISSALLTTVVGLVVAIPSTIGYNLLQGRLESESVDLEGFGEDLMGKLRLHYLEDR